MTEEKPVVIIDNGSFSCKACLGDLKTKCEFRTVGYDKNDGYNNERNCYVGNQSSNLEGLLNWKYPIEHGYISNWDYMEEIWNHVFYNGLGVQPEEHSVCLLNAVLTPEKHIKKMCEIMFEKFDVPHLYIMNTNVATVIGRGYLGGLVLNSGDGVTSIAQIYDGIYLRGNSVRHDFGGNDLIDYLIKLVNEKDVVLNSSYGREIVREIKEKLCYAAEDPEQTNVESAEYVLPDGKILNLKNERFECVEALFNPKLMCSSSPGILEMLFDSLNKVEKEVKAELYKSLIFTGGNMKFPGIDARLKKEIGKIDSKYRKCILDISETDKIYQALEGASIFASLDNFKKERLSKSSYKSNASSVECFKTI